MLERHCWRLLSERKEYVSVMYVGGRTYKVEQSTLLCVSLTLVPEEAITEPASLGLS